MSACPWTFLRLCASSPVSMAAGAHRAPPFRRFGPLNRGLPLTWTHPPWGPGERWVLSGTGVGGDPGSTHTHAPEIQRISAVRPCAWCCERFRGGGGGAWYPLPPPRAQRTPCPTNTPVWTVILEDFVVRWPRGLGDNGPGCCAQTPPEPCPMSALDCKAPAPAAPVMPRTAFATGLVGAACCCSRWGGGVGAAIVWGSMGRAGQALRGSTGHGARTVQVFELLRNNGNHPWPTRK